MPNLINDARVMCLFLDNRLNAVTLPRVPVFSRGRIMWDTRSLQSYPVSGLGITTRT